MRRDRIVAVTILGLVTAPIVSGAAQTSQADSPPTTLAAAATPLRAGDVLRLRIWREADLSGDFQIDENGRAILPRLGATVVTGVPTDQLRDKLTEQYREYLNNPSIEVIPLRRIAVLGAVRNPGFHRIDPSVTLGEAVSVAGGATPQSKQNMVELRRGPTRWQFDLTKQPDRASIPLTSGDQVYVPERSWLKQNATWFVSTLVGIAGTAAYLIVR